MTDKSIPLYYPIFLNISGKKCVVIGGGQVAFRKVQALLKHGADVEVISRDICPELTQLVDDGRINLHQRSYRPGDLDEAFIAIAATDNNELNKKIANEAQRECVLINTVDNAADSDFIAPAYLQRGNITIAISTAGSSPALARKIRARLEHDLDDEYASLALLVEEVRTELKLKKIEIDSDDWQKALDLDVLIDLLKQGKKEKARSSLLDNLHKKV